MLVAVMCFDKKEGGLETRMANREDHFAHIKTSFEKIVFGGPFLGEDGKTPVGSMLIFDVESVAEARAIIDNDPYSKAGVFERVDIVPWSWTIKNPDG